MTPGMIWFQIFLWLPGTNSWLASDLVAWHLLHWATSVIKLISRDRVTPVSSKYKLSDWRCFLSFSDSRVKFGFTSCVSANLRWLLVVFDTVRASLVAQMVRASASNAGALGSIPGSGRSPGEGNGNPLQYLCLEKTDGLQSMGVTKIRTWLSDFTFTMFKILRWVLLFVS